MSTYFNFEQCQLLLESRICRIAINNFKSILNDLLSPKLFGIIKTVSIQIFIKLTEPAFHK